MRRSAAVVLAERAAGKGQLDLLALAHADAAAPASFCAGCGMRLLTPWRVCSTCGREVGRVTAEEVHALTMQRGRLLGLLAARPAEAVELPEEPTCAECSATLLPPYLDCAACGPDADAKTQDAPSLSWRQRHDHASLTIAKCLVNAAGLSGAFDILIPYPGPDRVLVEQARAIPGTFANINGCASEASYLEMLPSEKWFERVILWSGEMDLDNERAYFLHGYELTAPTGKIVAAISSELASDRSFRFWATKKSATFDEPGTSFRSRGLVMVTLWKQS